MLTCQECGFDASALKVEELPTKVRSFGRRYRAPLSRFLPGEDGDVVVRAHPEPGVWSALGYAAHVRDVLRLYRGRIERILAEDRPQLDGIDPDAIAEEGRYDSLDPAQVADELAGEAESFAATLEQVPADAWDRVGLRGDSERSVLDVARGAVHEGGHHLLDIGRGLRAVRAQ